MATLPLAVMVVMARSNRLDDVLPFVPIIEEELARLRPQTFVEVFLR